MLKKRGEGRERRGNGGTKSDFTACFKSILFGSFLFFFSFPSSTSSDLLYILKLNPQSCRTLFNQNVDAAAPQTPHSFRPSVLLKHS